MKLGKEQNLASSYLDAGPGSQKKALITGVILTKHEFIVYRTIVFLLGMIVPVQLIGGKYAAEFLRIGVGARALGMGGAFVAIADDGSASYWNPAGLGNLARHQIHFSHVQLFDNLAQHHFANLSLKVTKRITLGVSWIRLSVDDIPRYSALEGTRYDRILNPDLRSTGMPEGFFTDVENGWFLAFSRGFDFDLAIGGGLLPTIIPSRLCLGVSYKYISQKLDAAEGRGQGLDIGMMLKLSGPKMENGVSRRKFALGINFQDVAGTTVVWNTIHHTRDRLPFNFLTGLSYSEWLPWLRGPLTLSFGRDNCYGTSNHWGGEFVFRNILSVRAGMKNNRFTAGAGLKIFGLGIDYAFVSYDLGNSHRISGIMEF